MEPVDNPQEETSQAGEALAKQSVLPISPSTLRADDSQQVSCLKGQFSQSVEHLGMCRDVRASSLCQRPLRRRNIEQAANAVAVRLGRRRKLLLPSKLILPTDGTLELERRVVSRARFSDSGLGCIDFGKLLQEVGA